MMGTQRIKKVTRNPKGSGNVLSPEQIKSGLDGQLFELAKLIKEFMIAEANKGRQHKLRADGKEGFVQSSKVDFTTDGIKIDIPQHAQWMDSGRRAGAKRVPISALINWLKRYRVVSRDKKTGKYQKSAEGSINSTAWAIQKAIFKNGIKPRPFIESTLDYAEGLLEDAIEEVMIPEIISIVDFHFNNKK
jgi:hypothetical protein